MVVALTCQNCRGALNYTPGQELAYCPFCGSTHLVRLPVHPFDALRDVDASNLFVSHFLPSLSLQDASGIVVDAIRKVDGGFKQPERLKFEVTLTYMPIWQVEADVHCTWHGEYSEQRTVTKWRKVYNDPPGGPRYEANEPYNAIETIWHPTSGTHRFSIHFTLTAAGVLSQNHLAAVSSGLARAAERRGQPAPGGVFSVAQPDLSQAQAWDATGTREGVDGVATSQCQNCVEHLTSVTPFIENRRFSLVFVPMALVRYTANESEHLHFVNLKSGAFSGDLPSDESQVKAECLRAGHRQWWLDVILGTNATVWLVAFAYLSAHFARGNPEVFTENFGLWSIGAVISAWIYYRSGEPWNNFLWKRQAHLLRLLGHPPSHLAEQMYEGEHGPSIQAKVKEMAENNRLEGAGRSLALPLLNRPGKVLLHYLSPPLAFRLPKGVTWSVRIILMLIAVLVACKQRL